MGFLERTRRDQFYDWLRRYSTPVGVVCAAGQISPAIAAHKAWNGDFGSWDKTVGITSVFVVLVCAAAALLAVQASKSLLTDKTTEEICRRLIKMLAESCRREGGHVRGNIMFVTASGTRKVHTVTAYNMASDTDRALEIRLHAGVSGRALLEEKGFIGDLREPGMNVGLSDAESRLVREKLNTILSVPIFEEQYHSQPTPLGTLQVDSDDTIEALGWHQDAAIIERAQAVADLISILLRSNP